MELHKKAQYNLLQINLPRIESGELNVADLEPWQTENYREHSTDTLLARLNELGISFDQTDFTHYAEEFEEPEELANSVAKERPTLEQDHAFLLIFELWRREFPEKRTLSIFCDELDFQMTQYDLGHDNEVGDMLAYLLQILEENVDKGLNPQETLQTIQTYCANEIESFLFDYTLAQLEEGEIDYAADLLDGFYPYINDSLWFAYLHARVAYADAPASGCERLEAIITEIDETTSIDLVEEMLYFLADSGNHTLFHDLAQKMFPLMQTEGDLKEFLEICYLHYDHLELPDPGIALSKIFHNRKAIAPETPLDENDPDLAKVQAILDQKLHL